VIRRGSPHRRLNITFACVAFVLSLFAGRLVQLQGLEGSTYRSLADNQRTTLVETPVLRGSITADDGTVLAMTVQTDKVIADPVLIPAAKRSQVADQLAGPLRMSPAAILADLSHPSSPQYTVLGTGVSMPAADRITALHLPGLSLQPSYYRSYPNGSLAANVIGFTNDPNGRGLTGAAGLEREYNSLLAGRDGSEEVETVDSGSQPIPLTATNVRQPVQARNLRLTIQPDIQYDAEQQCKLRVKQTKARNCSIVVMQPSTGKILAMAQYPTFNPSAPSNMAATTDIPVANVFAPGSTLKPITVAAALEKGHLTPMSTYTVPDAIVIDGFPFHDAEVHPTGRYTVAGILAYSSNVGMVQIVHKVPPRVQYHYLRAFGIGSKPGLGLPDESAGLLPEPSQWWGDERYTLSFGQGVAVSAVQMASVYATIANGGVRVQPSIVAGTTNSSGKFTAAPAPARRRVIKASTARVLMKILQQVPEVDAEQGEPWGEIAGYPIAAKTGTAQVPDPKHPKCLCQYGSSYIGIAPANHPKLVVAVNLQDPTANGYYGDVVAGPVFYKVMKFALQTMRIPPDGAKPPYIRLIAR
jgi:cell division protein FtsI (penicillin-binding protein 3)